MVQAVKTLFDSLEPAIDGFESAVRPKFESDQGLSQTVGHDDLLVSLALEEGHSAFHGRHRCTSSP
jgi:hypothetical protein